MTIEYVPYKQYMSASANYGVAGWLPGRHISVNWDRTSAREWEKEADI